MLASPSSGIGCTVNAFAWGGRNVRGVSTASSGSACRHTIGGSASAARRSVSSTRGVSSTSSRASQCVRHHAMFSGLSITYSGTTTRPRPRQAWSIATQCTLFFMQRATRSPRSKPRSRNACCQRAARSMISAAV